MKVTTPSFSAALPSLLSGAPACSARPSEASSSRPHSLGVLSNTNFDRHGAMPSAVQFCCAKSRACAVIGMLAHGSAADIIKIDNDNMRKVRADLLSPSSASIATLFHYLLTSTPLDSVLALECQCICYICGCEHQVAASARAPGPTRWMWGRRWCARASGKGRRDRLHRIVTFRGVLLHCDTHRRRVTRRRLLTLWSQNSTACW